MTTFILIMTDNKKTVQQYMEGFIVSDHLSMPH